MIYTKRRIASVLFYLWLILILIATVIPSKSEPTEGITYLDKVAHFLQYLFLAYLYYRMMISSGKTRKSVVFNLMIIAPILSVVTEVLQLWVPGRTFSLLDILANYLGFLTVILYLKYSEKKETYDTQVG